MATKIDLSSYKLPFPIATGSDQPVFLAKAEDKMKYDKPNNRFTTEREGSLYIIVCPCRRFQQIEVVVPNAPLAITLEELDALNAAGNYVMVTFTNFEMAMYQANKTEKKDVMGSATATGINIVSGLDAKAKI